MNSCKRLRGFTLIELLVVVSVIALLVSILLPALGKARQQAQGAICMTRCQQIAVGLYSYTMDFKEALPPYTDNVVHSAPNGESWTGPDGVNYTQYRKHILTTEWFKSGPYSGGPRDGDGFLGPYLQTGVSTGTSGILGCPSLPEDGYKNQEGRWDGDVYTVRGWHGNSYAQSLHATTGFPNFMGIKISIVATPAEFIPIAEGMGTCPYLLGPQDSPLGQTAYAPAARHNGRFSAVFLDGHADSGTLDEFYTPYYFHPNQQ